MREDPVAADFAAAKTSTLIKRHGIIPVSNDVTAKLGQGGARFAHRFFHHSALGVRMSGGAGGQ
jgi:hypothetical protein